jgi:hypothetical protein
MCRRADIFGVSRYARIMDAHYLFHRGTEFRLPFYSYDKQLWLRIFHSETARWDASSRAFCFHAGENHAWEAYFCRTPFVVLDEDSASLRTVGNFFKTRIDFTFEHCQSAAESVFFAAEYTEKLKTAILPRLP